MLFFPHPFNQLDNRQARKRIQIYCAQLRRVQHLHLEHRFRTRHRKYRCYQSGPKKKGTQQPLIVEEPFRKNHRPIRFAVEAVEQAGQTKGSERIGTSQQCAVLMVTGQERNHGHGSDDQSVHRDFTQKLPGQNRFLCRPWLVLHHFTVGRLHSQRDGRKTVGEKVDEQQMYRYKGNRQSGHRCGENRKNCPEVS